MKLTFNTSGEWDVGEWTTLLNSVSTIYNITRAITIVKYFESTIPENIRNSLPMLTTKEVLFNPNKFADAKNGKLKIHSIKMASPGEINFVGIADIIKEVGNLFIMLISIPEKKKNIKLSNQIKELDVESKKIANEASKLDNENKKLQNEKLQNEIHQQEVYYNKSEFFNALVLYYQKYNLSQEDTKELIKQTFEAYHQFTILLLNDKIKNVSVS